MHLFKITLTCPPALAEPLGVLLEDEALAVTLMVPPRHATAQIEAIYAEEPDAAALNTRLALFAALEGSTISPVRVEPVGDLDWLKKVAADFPPLPLARWTVYGAEHRRAVKNSRLALQIDATSAFGTGEHPTTRGCLVMLDKVLKRHQPKTLLDIGCGSGILAMGFAKACRNHAVAVDLDPESVRIARNNVRLNGLASHVKTGRSRGTLAPLARSLSRYDIIMANIFARPLRVMAKDVKRHLRPHGIVILAGLLNTQANGVLTAYRAQRLYPIKRIVDGEWTVLTLRG